MFPERRSYTVEYQLSDQEALLYEEVTEYVREEMNRADRLAEGGGQARSAVGLRPNHTPAPARVLARGDLPVLRASPRGASKQAG